VGGGWVAVIQSMCGEQGSELIRFSKASLDQPQTTTTIWPIQINLDLIHQHELRKLCVEVSLQSITLSVDRLTFSPWGALPEGISPTRALTRANTRGAKEN
jgi:hypothetical protein